MSCSEWWRKYDVCICRWSCTCVWTVFRVCNLWSYVILLLCPLMVNSLRLLQVSVSTLAKGSVKEREMEITQTARIADHLLSAGRDTLIMTSRELVTGSSKSAYSFQYFTHTSFQIKRNDLLNFQVQRRISTLEAKWALLWSRLYHASRQDHVTFLPRYIAPLQCYPFYCSCTKPHIVV